MTQPTLQITDFSLARQTPDRVKRWRRANPTGKVEITVKAGVDVPAGLLQLADRATQGGKVIKSRDGELG